MKNILVISASPRKGGNSDVLCDEFIKGAQQAGHKVEKIFLRNFKVNYCTGCGVCNSTRKCVQTLSFLQRLFISTPWTLSSRHSLTEQCRDTLKW